MERARLAAIQAWLVEQGLLGADEDKILSGFCSRCVEGGVELTEAVLFVDTLHPVLESWGFFWSSHEGATRAQQFPRSDAATNADRWQESPFFRMQQEGVDELHLDLSRKDSREFPIFQELREQGLCGYFAMIHRLSGEKAIGEMDSLYSRWSTAKLGGFSYSDAAALRALVPSLALSIKTAALRRIAQSLVTVYLGRDPGQRVLDGRIARGALDSINTVLWYSDMADFTAISEKIETACLIDMLNDYAEATISSIYESGGDVLKLVGDGVLAIFKAPSLEKAALSALSARRALAIKIAQLNSVRAGGTKPITDVYLSLHVGEVFYGNIGSEERLDFTVIGPAVNEVCRIAAIPLAVGGSLLVSSEFHSLLPDVEQSRFGEAGFHHLRGVAEPKRILIEHKSLGCI